MRQDITELNVAWQNRDNPYAELKSRIETLAAEVERISKTLNRESIVKSVLAALPGGKAAAKRQEPYALPPVAIVPDPVPEAPAPAQHQCQRPILPAIRSPNPSRKLQHPHRPNQKQFPRRWSRKNRHRLPSPSLHWT